MDSAAEQLVADGLVTESTNSISSSIPSGQSWQADFNDSNSLAIKPWKIQQNSRDKAAAKQKTKRSLRAKDEKQSDELVYIQPWQAWLIQKYKSFHPMFWDIMLWLSLIIGVAALQSMAWRSYWYPTNTQPLTAADVHLTCYAEDSPGSKYVATRDKVACNIITRRGALLKEFMDPPYRLAGYDEINQQPFLGVDGGVYFTFSFIAPAETGTYVVQCLGYNEVEDTRPVLGEDNIHVVQIAPNDVEIECVSAVHHSYWANYHQRVVCTITTAITVSKSAFYTPGTLLVNGVPDANITLLGSDAATMFKAEYFPPCKPQKLLFQVRVIGRNQSDAVLVPNAAPLFTVKMPDERQVHLHCYNPRTNGAVVSRQSLVVCHITTDAGVYARVDDFTDPPISITPEVPSISAAEAIPSDDDRGDGCVQKFEITFVSPPLDVELQVRGHLRSGATLFADDAVFLAMKHISPRPHELQVDCNGDLSLVTGYVLHQETVFCAITSEFEFLPLDFMPAVFRVYDEHDAEYTHPVINVTSFVGRAHRTGVREQTHLEYDVRFEILDDSIKLLKLFAVLNDGSVVNDESPIVLNTISCPRDGAIHCKHWQWTTLNAQTGDTLLRLLPPDSSGNKHHYVGDWKFITFAGITDPHTIVELDISQNQLPSTQEPVFESFPELRRLRLHHNRLKSLSADLFAGLHQLQELDVAHNKISELAIGTFSSVKQLQKIDFADNALHKVPSIFHVIADLGDLHELGLVGNGLTYIEEEILNMQQLTAISVGGEFQCVPQFVALNAHKISKLPQGPKCRCPAALLTGGDCGDWAYVQRHCVNINNDTTDPCLPALMHNGRLDTLTALDSLDLTGFDDVGILNVSGNNLTVLPNTFVRRFPALRVLDASHNQIAALHSNTFEHTTPTYIFIDNNVIGWLPPMLLPVTLLHVSMHHNAIHSIEHHVFGNLPQLRYLNLGDNRIDELPSDFLAESTELSDLILLNNQLKRVEPQMFVDKLIGNVDFSGNEISYLYSEQFKTVRDIGVISFARNKLNGLPNHLFDPEIEFGLQAIDFSANHIYNIAPHFLPKAPQLSFINLAENHITKIPAAAFENFHNLLELDLHANALTVLSYDMFPESPKLLRLDLKHNPITKIENKMLFKFPKLEYLDLSDTELNRLDVDDLYGVPDLVELKLDHSKLATLQMNQFQHVPNLEVLSLSHTRLESISEVNFNVTFSKLTELHIDHIPFRWIGDRAFVDFPNIETVDLSNCNLTSEHISKHAFADAAIVSLQLSYNQLTELNRQWFNDLQQLQRLNLSNNPIRGIRSEMFDDAINLELIDLRGTNIRCQPQWLLTSGMVVLLEDGHSHQCISCLQPGWWSNGTLRCQQCGKHEICLNDEWDATGTYRLKKSVAGEPPESTTLSFVDDDTHPNIIGGVLKWGEIPLESLDGNTEEWAFYLSRDGVTADTTAVAVTPVNDENQKQVREYRIVGLGVGFNRFLLMYGRNGGGDGDTFSVLHFTDNCHICVFNFTFINHSPRRYHIMGKLSFLAPINQQHIAYYNVYIGHDPYTSDIAGAFHKIKVLPQRKYEWTVPELNINGMPFIWLRSFYIDGSATNDVQATEIRYAPATDGQIRSVARDTSNFDINVL